MSPPLLGVAQCVPQWCGTVCAPSASECVLSMEVCTYNVFQSLYNLSSGIHGSHVYMPVSGTQALPKMSKLSISEFPILLSLTGNAWYANEALLMSIGEGSVVSLLVMLFGQCYRCYVSYAKSSLAGLYGCSCRFLLGTCVVMTLRAVR